MSLALHSGMISYPLRLTALVILVATACGLNLNDLLMKQSKLLRSKLALLSTAVVLIGASPSEAVDLDKGAALFTSSCSGCHAGGSNLFSGSKTLFMNALVKYKYDTSEAMEALISKGKGQMPAYGSFISPKGNVMPAKYSPEEIKDVSGYVLSQAAANWVVAK